MDFTSEEGNLFDKHTVLCLFNNSSLVPFRYLIWRQRVSLSVVTTIHGGMCVKIRNIQRTKEERKITKPKKKKKEQEKIGKKKTS